MALSTIMLFTSMLIMLPLVGFAIAMLAISSAKVVNIEFGGIKNEDNIWN